VIRSINRTTIPIFDPLDPHLRLISARLPACYGNKGDKMKIFRVIAVGLMLVTPVQAQDFDSGMEAYRAGDYAGALQNWRPLAERGHLYSQYNLGNMFYNGQGVPQDFAAAELWFRMAAEQGHASAQTNLGVNYGFGEGVPQDYVIAHMWSNIGAANGNADGARLRDEYLVPKMTPSDISEAQRRARVCMESNYQNCD
jgi:TPR repeat protein